jgi:hypothetical protein
MATTGPTDFGPSAFRRLDPAKYTALGDFLNQINKPDNREALVKTYGAQSITGFLALTGAVKANGADDQVQWWEETRLHPKQAFSGATADIASTATTGVLTYASGEGNIIRVNDVILLNNEIRAIVTAVTPTAGTTASGTFTFKTLADAVGTAIASTATGSVPVIGNLFAQGTDQQDMYVQSNVVKRTNKYMILKEVYKVNGSQATNIGWINYNGDYRWYVKSEADTRQRFLDKREMMMLLGQAASNSIDINGGIDGSEGYFDAIENRGIVQGSAISALTDIDGIILELDKQGAPAEYAMYVNRSTDLAIDDLLATNITAASALTAPANFGTFANAKDMMLNLGFKSFNRGSYTFHKTSWKLLNEPTLLSGSKFKGVMIPVSSVVDPKTGERAPALEMNYKNTNGYSREMEHWMTGSILGVTNSNVDELQFNYRSECNLVTRAANQHVLIKY